MSAAPEHEDTPIQHRPLPSVDIALLPSELRAARVRQWSLAAAALALLLLGLGLAFGASLLSDQPSEETEARSVLGFGSHDNPGLADPAPHDGVLVPAVEAREAHPQPDGEPSADTRDPAPEVALRLVGSTTDAARTERKFGAARSFKDALRNAGASAEEATELIAALEGLVDFRHGKPEHLLVFERDGQNLLREFEYRAGVTEYTRVTRGQNGKLRGERIQVPIDRRRIAKGTQIAGSLGQSLAALGLGASLAGVVIEAFDAKLSFTKDSRAGDSVKVIVDEEYVDGKFLRYGTVHAIEYTSERKGKLQAFWFEPARGEGEFYDPGGRAMHGGWLRTPLRYDHVSSPYNPRRRHPILKRIMPHNGVDYSAGTGTPVWAAAAGSVTFAGARGANGNLVSLKHSNGYETYYAHLWRIAPGMRPGTRVKQRQLIGYVGTTGRSTGPHLHFALKRHARFIDPTSQLNGPGLPLPSAAMPRFRSLAQRLRNELDRISLAAPPTIGAPDDDAPSVIEEETDL